jgi:hypothetical protein
MEGEFNMVDLVLSIATTAISFIGMIFWVKLNKVEEKTNLLEVLVNGKYITREEALANDEKRQLVDEKILTKLDTVKDEIKEEIHACKMGHYTRRQNDDRSTGSSN